MKRLILNEKHRSQDNRQYDPRFVINAQRKGLKQTHEAVNREPVTMSPALLHSTPLVFYKNK